MELREVFRHLLHLQEAFFNSRGEEASVANDSHPDLFALEEAFLFGELLELGEDQVHQEVHFFFGAAIVFEGEGE